MFLQIAGCAALIRIMRNPKKYDLYHQKAETAAKPEAADKKAE